MSMRVQELIKHLPAAERRLIGDQVSRAADSVRFNIVEGCGLNTDPQLARHLLQSLGSVSEVEDQLEALKERGLLREEDEDLLPEVGEIRAMLAALHRTVSRQRRRPKRPPPPPPSDS
jgi:four helix bundle protein